MHLVGFVIRIYQYARSPQGGNPWVSDGLFLPVAVPVSRIQNSDLFFGPVAHCAQSVPESYYGRSSKVCVWKVRAISQHDVQGF